MNFEYEQMGVAPTSVYDSGGGTDWGSFLDPIVDLTKTIVGAASAKNQQERLLEAERKRAEAEARARSGGGGIDPNTLLLIGIPTAALAFVMLSRGRKK